MSAKPLVAQLGVAMEERSSGLIDASEGCRGFAFSCGTAELPPLRESAETLTLTTSGAGFADVAKPRPALKPKARLILLGLVLLACLFFLLNC